MTDSKISKTQKFRNLARFGALMYLVTWLICQSGLMFFLFLSPNPPFLHDNIYNRKDMTDFVRIYSEAKLAAEKPTQIYDPDLQMKTAQDLLHTSEPIDSASNNAYTPHMCVILSPMSKVPLIQAYWTWLIASVAAGVLGMLLILKRERKMDNWTTATIILAILGTINSMTVLLMGQTTWFMFLFFCGLYVSLAHASEIGAGTAFALLTIKPQYSFLVFAGLIGDKRWKALFIFAALTAAMLAMAGLVVGWDNIIHYPEILSKKSAGDEFWYPRDQVNLRAIFSWLMPYATAYKIAFICVFLAMPFVWKLWSTIKNDPDRRRWIFAITVLLALTFGPHANPYDCMLVGIPAILTLPSASPIELWKIDSKPLKYWCFLLLVYPSLGWVIGSHNYLFIPLNVGLIVCGLLHLKTLHANPQTGAIPEQTA